MFHWLSSLVTSLPKPKDESEDTSAKCRKKCCLKKYSQEDVERIIDAFLSDTESFEEKNQGLTQLLIAMVVKEGYEVKISRDAFEMAGDPELVLNVEDLEDSLVVKVNFVQEEQ